MSQKLKAELIAALKMLREERVARGAAHAIIDQRIHDLEKS
jgi:hypothetical protein